MLYWELNVDQKGYNINPNKCTHTKSLVGNIECKKKSYKPKQGGWMHITKNHGYKW
jgi:hypothetical protein